MSMKINVSLFNHIINTVTDNLNTDLIDSYKYLLNNIHKHVEVFYHDTNTFYANKEFVDWLKSLKDNEFKERSIILNQIDRLISRICIYEYKIPEIVDVPIARIGDTVIINEDEFKRMRSYFEKETLMNKVRLYKDDFIKLLSPFSAKFKLSLLENIIDEYLSNNKEEITEEEEKIFKALKSVMDLSNL